MTNWETATWATVVPVQTLFALIAVLLTFLLKKGKKEDTETFITARKQAGLLAIGWSFFSGALGAWVFTAPAGYATYAGILGLTFYALSTGLPLILLAAFGDKIQTKYPHITSSGEFMGLRFGSLAQLLFISLMLFNMGIAVLAEFSTIAAIFSDFVLTNDVPIVIVQGSLTLLYTTVGGTLISIVTDQFQGFTSLVLTIIIGVWVAINFRFPLEKPIPEYLKGTNTYGYSSILTLPVSLTFGTIFSEAVWQKVWASSDRRSLFIGATVGSTLSILTVFGLGFLGVLAAWANLIDFENTNPNLYLFQIFSAGPGTGVTTLNSWIGLVTVIGAAIMSESAVDSIQNGLMGILSSYWLKGQPVLYARILVVLVNVPLVIIGLQGYNVLSLFLIANMLCTTAGVPFLLGTSRRLEKYYTGDMVIFSTLLSFVATSFYGIADNWESSGHSIQYGMWFTWYANGYLWQYFAVALGASIAGPIIFIPTGMLLNKLTGVEKIKGPSHYFELFVVWLQEKVLRPIGWPLPVHEQPSEENSRDNSNNSEQIELQLKPDRQEDDESREVSVS